jgi:iron complex outermembrane receptor protein
MTNRLPVSPHARRQGAPETGAQLTIKMQPGQQASCHLVTMVFLHIEMLCYYIFTGENTLKHRVPLLAGFTLGLFVQPISAAQTLTLEEIPITDSYVEERAEGPVQGYRATRSATATRTDTDLRDTPQSIDVVPAQVIRDLNTTRIDRALDFAGGVARQNNFGGLPFLNYSVRGFTTGELYRNGFAINRGSYSAPDTSSLERIEVLKGPAASLYGRGDPGGLVNLVTKRPQAERFSTLAISAGSWDRYRSTLDANSPLDSEGNVLGRINMAVEDNGSFRDHVSSERRIVSPSLSWQLTPDTKLLLDSEFSRTDAVFDRGIAAVNGELGSVKRATFVGEPNDGKIRNDNQTLDLALEHFLSESWKLRLANHYTQGTLKGASSEPQALVGNTITRFYRERDFEWNDNITKPSCTAPLTGPAGSIRRWQAWSTKTTATARNTRKVPPC